MKRWSIIALMLFAFVLGFTMTYNCGGGSTAEAEGDADTLQGHPASDFALVDHEHDAGDITSGVLDISLIPAHTHPDYALSNHTHDEYMEEITCSTDQVLKWSGSAWVCAEDNNAVNTDADTLDGMDSSDFAESNHTHPYLRSIEFGWHDFDRGVIPINSPDEVNQGYPSSGTTMLYRTISLPSDHLPGTEVQLEAYLANDSAASIGGDAVMFIWANPYPLGEAMSTTAPSSPDWDRNIFPVDASITGTNVIRKISWSIPTDIGDELIAFYFGRDGDHMEDTETSTVYLVLIRMTFQATTL